LFESRAIARYLAKKYAFQGTDLIPSDPLEEAIFEQGASIETFNFFPLAQRFARELLFNPMQGFASDESRAKEAYAKLNANLDAYDEILGRQRYIGGNMITLADLFHVPYGSLLVQIGRGEVFESRANVARWWKEISSRPSWLAVQEEFKLHEYKFASV